MQKVYLGRTISGTLGYFTGGMLAWPLRTEEYNNPEEWHMQNCARLQFEFVSSKLDEETLTWF